MLGNLCMSGARGNICPADTQHLDARATETKAGRRLGLVLVLLLLADIALILLQRAMEMSYESCTVCTPISSTGSRRRVRIVHRAISPWIPLAHATHCQYKPKHIYTSATFESAARKLSASSRHSRIPRRP